MHPCPFAVWVRNRSKTPSCLFANRFYVFLCSENSRVVVFSPTMKTNWMPVLFLLAVVGCSRAVTPGATFLVGLNDYQDEMHSLAANPELWTLRQRTAQSLKTTHVATMGGSTEFNRLVSLDLRRREYLIALRDPALKPEREREIQEELVRLNKEAD